MIGSPRSGTTFLGAAIGGVSGFVDLGEVQPLKASMPDLFGADEAECARRIRRILQAQRLLALVPGMRGVEQGPETGFVFPAALRAYPQGRAVHILRDGRDVVCSLLERGWLRAGQARWRDQVKEGQQARFWAEPERREEFVAASEATRAAWVWRRYVTAARRPHERKIEIRYEDIAENPDQAATLGECLDASPVELAVRLREMHDRSIGRWKRDLTAEQLADVEREAGDLLAETGYA